MVAQNCLTQPIGTYVIKNLSLSISTSSSTTITNGLSNTSGASISVTADPEILATGFGSLGTTFSYSETISTSTAKSTGTTNQWSDSVQI